MPRKKHILTKEELDEDTLETLALYNPGHPYRRYGITGSELRPVIPFKPEIFPHDIIDWRYRWYIGTGVTPPKSGFLPE